MSNELVITLVILAAAIILFLSERLSIDLVALLVLVALGLSRVLTSQEVFSGLSDTAVITVLALSGGEENPHPNAVVVPPLR